jgi:hypothetical protein
MRLDVGAPREGVELVAGRGDGLECCDVRHLPEEFSYTHPARFRRPVNQSPLSHRKRDDDLMDRAQTALGARAARRRAGPLAAEGGS